MKIRKIVSIGVGLTMLLTMMMLMTAGSAMATEETIEYHCDSGGGTIDTYIDAPNYEDWSHNNFGWATSYFEYANDDEIHREMTFRNNNEIFTGTTSDGSLFRTYGDSHNGMMSAVDDIDIPTSGQMDGEFHRHVRTWNSNAYQTAEFHIEDSSGETTVGFESFGDAGNDHDYFDGEFEVGSSTHMDWSYDAEGEGEFQAGTSGSNIEFHSGMNLDGNTDFDVDGDISEGDISIWASHNSNAVGSGEAHTE